MSALARFCLAQNRQVAGYNKTPHLVSKALEKEGFEINYADNLEEMPADFKSKDTLVVYTPAVPKQHKQLNFFKEQGNLILKRAQFLAMLSQSFKSLAIAGTHGKTTTSAMLSHILTAAGLEPWSFLGGIANNLGTNFREGDSELMVLEADEFDRSFLHLNPSACLISSVEADHLDIYGHEDALVETFHQLATLTRQEDGQLLVHESVKIPADYTYGWSEASDYRVESKEIKDGLQHLQLKSPNGSAKAQLALPGNHNAENALGALAISHMAGLEWSKACATLESFSGVYRRFDIHIRGQQNAYVDDYAHHPTEIKAAIQGARELYPDLKLMVVFQPHLYSRTNDFMDQFGKSLSAADELVLLPIYGAREEPMEGVSSEVLLEKCELSNKRLVLHENFLTWIQLRGFEGLVMTLGAGDIDQLVPGIRETLKKQWNEA